MLTLFPMTGPKKPRADPKSDLYQERLYALKIKQALPLGDKIELSMARIRHWYEHFHGHVYVSFSGGKDSTVLLDLVRSEYPGVEAVFVNTGLEYPEIVNFAKNTPNVTMVRPEANFRKIIETHGWPLISKDLSEEFDNLRSLCRNGTALPEAIEKVKARQRLKPQWHYLLNAPFDISGRCCHFLKTGPLKRFTQETGKTPYVGTMATDSVRRKWGYAKAGKCNITSGRSTRSAPLTFWTTEDVLRYIKTRGLPLAPIYGDIVETFNGGGGGD